MEIKKTQNADLENKRSIFFKLGLIVALSIVLVAFEWTTKDTHLAVLDGDNNVPLEEEWMAIPTKSKEPEPVKIEKPKIAVDFKILEKDEKPTEKMLEVDNFFVSDQTKLAYSPEIFDEPEPEVETTIIDFIKVEKKPEYPGGERELIKFLAQEVEYPITAVDLRLQGRVIVGFIINEKGKVQDVTILRGVHPLLDKEAEKVVKKMKKWKPGEQMGRNVCVRYTVPILFRLQN